MPTATTTSAADLQAALRLLYAERALARERGLDRNRDYADRLEADIAFHLHAYVGAAVTEIATLRGGLSGRLSG